MGDVVTGLSGIAAAFGLASSAGLNAYIPLLAVAVLGRVSDMAGWDLLRLHEPWDLLTSWWVIGILAVLLLVEVFVDKIPAADTANDVINTVIRPAAGAILFAANANVITDIHPILAIVCGLLLAGSVHAVKATARPVVTAATGGIGNPIVSTLEDVVAAIVSILSIVIPILAAAILLLLLGALVWRWRRRRSPDAA